MVTHKLGSSIGELLKFTIEKRHQHVGTKEHRMMLFGPKSEGSSKQKSVEHAPPCPMLKH
jgi:hypothetical protein